MSLTLKIRVCLFCFCLFFFGYVWFSAHFCLWWLKYTYIFFSSIGWLFMFILVLPICNWELYVLKNLFSVILNSRRASPGLICFSPFSYFLNPFLDFIWYVPHRYVLDCATLIFLAGWQTRKKLMKRSCIILFFIRTLFYKNGKAEINQTFKNVLGIILRLSVE